MKDLLILTAAVAGVYFTAMYWVNLPWFIAAGLAIAGTAYAGSRKG